MLILPLFSKGKKRFNKNTLNSLFPENPHLSSALHGFMEAHAKAESLDEITFDIFEASRIYLKRIRIEKLMNSWDFDERAIRFSI